MTRNEILELAIKTGKVRYDEQICDNFDWKDFDDEKFGYYLKLAHISYNLPREVILKNLRVLTSEGITNAGILYFAKEPYQYIISSKIRCIHFNDNLRVDILDKKVVDRGIIGNIEFAESYLKERIPVRYEIKDFRRQEFPEYPLEAYREAIVNSIIHFDYFLGDIIAIEKLKNSITINNKGELLFPESDFGERSEARNRLLSDLLARTHFMEKAGTGIKRVRDACNKNGNKVSFRFTDAFWVTIHSNIKAANGNIGDVTENVTENVTEKRLISIIQEIKSNNKISTTSLAKKLQVTRMTISRDMVILKERKLIKRIGHAKGGHWHIIDKD